MTSAARRSVRAIVLGFAALFVSAALGAGGCSQETTSCESKYEYFATSVWPVIGQHCQACHSAQGLARETSYVLKGPAEAGFLEHNLEVFSDVASFQKDGVSQVLLKPTLKIAHEGGKVIQDGSPEYQALEGFVELLEQGDDCQPRPVAHFTGVELLDGPATLRKATLLLAGRLPTDAEIEHAANGGPEDFELVLREMMTEPPFVEFVKNVYGDLFLTDFYLNNATNQIDDLAYADPFWFETASKELLSQYGFANLGELERFTNISLAREPLELVAHVVKNDRPFSEILTADYLMVTPLSARSYGIADATFEKGNDPLEFVEGHLPDFPHAGVLTSPILLSRHPTTPTNRNRARARKVMLWFLGTNILLTAEQPVDQTKVTSLNPTRDDPNCTVCHASLDPIAGAFQAFDDAGGWTDAPEWHPEMFPPGFGDEQLPLSDSATGVRWLARRIVADDRFALGVVFNMYKGLTGRDPLIAPSDPTDAGYDDAFASYLAQADTFRHIAERFRESDFDLKTVVVELVKTPYFRATNSVPLGASRAARLGEVGRAQLLSPEQLHAKIHAVFGIPWTDNNRRPVLRPEYRNPARLGQLQLFYGGIDNNSVVRRITEPNGVMAAVAERMSLEMSCKGVSYDFARALDERLLFPPVDIDGTLIDPLDLEPETDAGLPIDLAQRGIRTSLVHLYERVLGKRLDADDPEIDRAFELFVETWREGKKGMRPEVDDPLPLELPNECRAVRDFYSGAELSEDRRIVADDKYVVRSWMAVVTYLLGDYHFLYE